jgi:hypothetical protein
MTHPDPSHVVKRVIELLGGKDRLHEVLDAEFGEMRRRWDTDPERIGRVLRAHLYVEHYLTENIQNANPRLGQLSKTRISFSQKVALLDRSNKNLNEAVPGIERLNAIRNRLAHQLDVKITDEDLTAFRSAGMFWAMREESAKPASPSTDHLDILEDFARHAVHWLSHEFSAFSKVFGQAIDDVRNGEGDA